MVLGMIGLGSGLWFVVELTLSFEFGFMFVSLSVLSLLSLD